MIPYLFLIVSETVENIDVVRQIGFVIRHFAFISMIFANFEGRYYTLKRQILAQLQLLLEVILAYICSVIQTSLPYLHDVFHSCCHVPETLHSFV